jgi:PAP2 superfamily protein
MKRLLAAIVIVVQGPGYVFAQEDAARPAAVNAPAAERADVDDANGQSFWSLFRSIGGDVTRLGTRQPLIVLAIGGGLAALAKPSDNRTLRAMTRSTGLEDALDAGAFSGDGRTQVGGAFAVYAIGALMRSPRVEGTGADLIQAQAVSGLLTLSLKAAVPRARPDGGRHSFPSGHSSAAFATADVVEQHFGWKAGVPAYIGAAYIGASRIAERHHFLSDVVFGSAIGIASARTLSFAGRAREVRITPAPTRGGAAVIVTLISLR